MPSLSSVQKPLTLTVAVKEIHPNILFKCFELMQSMDKDKLELS